MSRLLPLSSLMLVAAVAAPAATLEKLSLDELIEKSTAIVRGSARAPRVDRRGPLLYTVYAFDVEQRWKGPSSAALEIALPGGRDGGFEQRFGGVPELGLNQDYLLFLWTGPSGRTQITGLGQGVFRVVGEQDERRVVREPLDDVVFAPSSEASPADPVAMEMTLEEMQGRIERVLEKGRTPER